MSHPMSPPMVAPYGYELRPHRIYPIETKPFFLTSEFGGAVLAIAGIAVTAASSDAFGAWRAWILITAVVVGYMVGPRHREVGHTFARRRSSRAPRLQLGPGQQRPSFRRPLSQTHTALHTERSLSMILRIDRLQTELPPPSDPDPAGAAAVQELLGGKFGEMSTFMNYTFQSFNFRNRQGARPFYDLIANIAAEEFGHIELVAATINTMLTGASPTTTARRARTAAARRSRASATRSTSSPAAQGALPQDSHGQARGTATTCSPPATSSRT